MIRLRNAALLTLLLLMAVVARADSPGALVIAGGAALPDEIRAEFLELAGGAEAARLVVLPTASMYADDADRTEWFLEPWVEAGVTGARLVHTRDPETADREDFVAPLREATGVWISGGDQRRLLAAYGGSLLEKELWAVLQRGGVIGGTSAGAAVMSNPMITGGADEAEIGLGFGFLPDVFVDQHFVARGRITRLRHALANHPMRGGLGVDESTAMVIRGDQLKVVGESTVTAIWPKQSPDAGKERVLNAGETLSLKAFRVASPATP